MDLIWRKYYEPQILVGFAKGNGCLIHYCYHWGLFLNDFMLGWCPDTSVDIISTSSVYELLHFYPNFGQLFLAVTESNHLKSSCPQICC